MADRIALVFHSDGGSSLLDDIDLEEHPGIEDALNAFIGVVRETLISLCSQREFRHVTLQETDEELQHADAKTAFGITIGTPILGADGELQQVVNIRHPLDLQALLTAKSGIQGTLGSKVVSDEEGVLQIADEALDKKVDKLLKHVKTAELLQEALTEEQEQLLVDALGSLAPALEEGQPEESLLEPMHPSDLLTLLVAYMAELIGEPPAKPNPIKRAASFVGGVLGAAARRARSARKVVWQVEDIAVAGTQLALKVARRSIRPILLGIVLNRTLQTLDAARSPDMRLARLSPAEQMESHFSRIMGPDWREQMEADFVDAAREVQDGYMTDDYRDEKRKMAAAMLRRLEVEDWDKERMRHFYYGSYGLGPWYFDMEERLHNPYFIGARAWNGPVEGWVGKNKAYADSVAAGNVDFSTAALDVLESQKGVELSPKQRAHLRQRQKVNASDLLLSNELLTRVMDKAKLKQALA